MTQIGKLTGALTALGLAIGTAPASAVFWDTGGGGIGGDKWWSPLDPRFEVIEGSMEFIETQDLGGGIAIGDVEITILTRGFAYNTEARKALNLVEDGTEFGIFAFTMDFTEAVLFSQVIDDRLAYSLQVRDSYDGIDDAQGSGTGFLEYLEVTLNNDALSPGFDPTTGDPVSDLQRDANGNLSIDGENLGDQIVLRTPDCGALEAGSDVLCPQSFFAWTGFADNDEQLAATQDGFESFFTTIPSDPDDFSPIPVDEVLSLFSARSPCPTDQGDFPNNPASPNILCNPIPDLFRDSSGVLDSEAYAAFALAGPAGIGVEATVVPNPGVIALFGVGLAGLGVTRRRR